MKVYLFFIIIIFISCSCSSTQDYFSFTKIDAHTHLETADSSFIEVSKKNNFKLISMVTNYQSTIEKQFEFAKELHQKYPEVVSFSTTFYLEDINKPEWEKNTIAWLQKCFDAGAIGVKVWKNIGMVDRNSDSSFIMVDDPRLDPIFDFIESQNKTVTAHIGEPKNCWLPIDSMTVEGDRSYFKNHPQYHMYLHPEYPKYSELIAARDRMLEKHPNLRVVGAHLGSIEWDVDELAKRLEKYPNFSVDMAERIVHFRVQDRKKVRDFIIKYQDRILYGTDIVINDEEFDGTSAALLEKKANNTWLEDWEYFTTNLIFTQNEKIKEYQGLDLPKSVIKKIFFENAERIFLGIN